MSRRRIQWAKKWHGGKFVFRRPKKRARSHAPKEKNDQPLAEYFIKAGTFCHVRKAGEKKWRPHTTRIDLHCHGYLWRNEYCYGFSQGKWEVKVRLGLFQREKGES